MSLPKQFCWTRFGTEAGETIDTILERKERERQRNGGIFLWGIGNAIGPSIRELLRVDDAPEVVFSPIRSAPRREDVAPDSLLVWTSARDLYGRPCRLPEWSMVTSRAGSGKRTKRHYALVCSSETPLEISKSPPSIAIGSLHNLLSNNRVGASQVTAVVRRHEVGGVHGAQYPAAIRTRLAPPFLLELCDPHPAVHGHPHRICCPEEPEVFRSRHGGAPSLCNPDS
jgi:hypothetical protein